MQETVMAISIAGRKLGRIPVSYAHQLIREKRARGEGPKQSFHTVIVFAACVVAGRALQTTYDEDLGNGLHLTMMKRHHSGGCHKWDQNLTFNELRKGRLLSEVTVADRAERRSLRKVESS
jgi:hypothetical protein